MISSFRLFFSDYQDVEIPDDGFSDRVMQALPAVPETEQTDAALGQSRPSASMEYLWTAACVAAGVVA